MAGLRSSGLGGNRFPEMKRRWRFLAAFCLGDRSAALLFILSGELRQNQAGDESDYHAKEASDRRAYRSTKDAYKYPHADTLRN